MRHQLAHQLAQQLARVATRLANGEADAWPVEISGIKLVLMTEPKFRELLERADGEITPGPMLEP